jgi:hypothetical protein
MKASHALRPRAWLVAGGALLSALAPARAADGVEGVTAVASKVSSDYVRARLPDGSFRPEYYAFGEGGKWAGELSDATIDPLHFIDVARVIAGPLAGQKYLPARDPAGTRLLIMVYWGTTAVPEPVSNSVAYQQFERIANIFAAAAAAGGPPASKGYHSVGSGAASGMLPYQIAEYSAALAMLNVENQQRTQNDFVNAGMLGYDSEGVIGTEHGAYVRGTPLGRYRDDLVSEIEENRYFVVLMAYDFQLLWKQRKHKLLWETRFSISERRNQFDKALPVMAQYASRYFGQPSDGLLRMRVPEGNVEVHEPTLIEFLSEPRK